MRVKNKAIQKECTYLQRVSFSRGAAIILPKETNCSKMLHSIIFLIPHENAAEFFHNNQFAANVVRCPITIRPDKCCCDSTGHNFWLDSIRT